MPASDYAVLRDTLTDRGRAHFDLAVRNIEAAPELGAIANVRFSEAKTSINRALEMAWEAEILRPLSWNLKLEASPEEREFLDSMTSAPQAHNIKGFLRKIEAAPEGDVKRCVMTFIATIEPLTVAVAAAKRLITKREVCAPEDITAAYKAPAASKTAMQQVYDVLSNVTEASKAEVAAHFRGRYTNLLDRFMRDQADDMASKEVLNKRKFSPLSWCVQIGRGRAESLHLSIIEECTTARVDVDLGRKVYDRAPESKAKISTRAAMDADEVCEKFIVKNLSKLQSIVDAKNNFDRIEIIGNDLAPNNMEGRLRVHFTDASSFEARSSVILAWAMSGKPYQRYPLTFHGVVMPDQSVMSRPSEERMNTVFITGEIEAVIEGQDAEDLAEAPEIDPTEEPSF